MLWNEISNIYRMFYTNMMHIMGRKQNILRSQSNQGNWDWARPKIFKKFIDAPQFTSLQKTHLNSLDLLIFSIEFQVKIYKFAKFRALIEALWPY